MKNRVRNDRRVSSSDSNDNDDQHQHQPHATTSSLMNHHGREETVFSVRDAERSFVERDFRQALHISNQILRDAYGKQPSASASTTSSTSTSTAANPDGCQQLSTPVCFQFDPSHSNRMLRVDLSSKSSPTDQAATIALQSWYEIITKQNKPLDDKHPNKHPNKHQHHQRDGLEYLRPFLDHYQLHPMPLEVMVIFLQFCQTHNHHHQHLPEATAITLELLIYRFQKKKDTNDADDTAAPTPTRVDESWNDTSYGELLENLLTSLLPRFDDQDVVRYHLQKLLQRRTDTDTDTDIAFPPSLESLSIITSSSPNLNLQTMNAILSLLQQELSPTQNSGGDDDGDGDDKLSTWSTTYIERSKKFLQDAILDREKGDVVTSRDLVSSAKQVSESESDSEPNPSAVTVSSRQPHTEGTRRSLSTNHTRLGRRQWNSAVVMLTSWTQKLVDHPNRWQYRGKLAFSLAMMLLAWRKKQRVKRISKGIATLLLSPVAELVEALSP